jgi:hypothetical protein
LQGHSDEEPGGVTRRPNPKRARGVILAAQKGRRNGERPPGSRESVLLRGRRRNENLGQLDKPNTVVSRKGALSKGAAERGAAEETPNLSQQRVGDKGRPAGNRGGALTQCASPSLSSVGLGRFPRPASLAAGRWGSPSCKRGEVLRSRQDLSSSSRNDRLFGDGCSANARERRAPRGERRSDAGEDIGARGCARMSNLVCRSR